MKIKSIRLRDFKRFTDLTISELPETAKLVVLIGPNGSGKSSVFDALHGKAVVRHYWGWQPEQSGYWNKKYSSEDEEGVSGFDDSKKIIIDFHGSPPSDQLSWKKSVYARSAYRNDPSVKMDNLRQVGNMIETPRFARMIDNDATVNLNYQRLVSDGLEEAFEKSDDKMTLGDFRHQLIGDIRGAIRRLFHDPPLDLNSLGNPLINGSFRFTKGTAKKFLYDNLSGGEKAAFDLVLDFVVKSRGYNDTVFCIDEPEAHMGLRLQAMLLIELYELIPDNCQLWIATHSVGMMRAAYDLEQSNPGKVIFLDFNNQSFDNPVVIKPSKIDRATWEEMHQLVLEDLAALLAPDKIVLCEGMHGEDGLDAQCYNTIFNQEYPNTLFVSTGGKRQGSNYSAVIKAIVNAEVILLRDKDNLSDRELNRPGNPGDPLV